MSLTTAARNQALDAITIDTMSLHSAFPGLTGSGELTGGGYARVSCTFNAASAGVRNLSAPANFTVGATHTVRWVGLWAGSIFKGLAPNGGSPREFQINLSNDTVTAPAHGYADNDTITFYGGTIPTGLNEGEIYFVRDSTTDTFKVAVTAGGLAIDITGQPAPDCVVSRITESAYGGADTHTVNSFSIGAVF
ncbi:hypothetical protein [Lysobacter panacisoli]|uniref:Uncharacterized protein n=1 Tax=Lysobacter panacisoli TaxID=1255263 RepID=A0ABP9LC81_9GAMM|nr:hypothetical protein [Lysobacter panacisoli]